MVGVNSGCPCAQETQYLIKPKSAWLTVNRRCNFRCKWCYGKGTKFANKKEMSLSFACEMVDLLVQSGIKNIMLIGGEPTLWKPLIDLNIYCNALKIETFLITNAMRFGEDSFWDRYTKSSNTSVGISLKASNPEQMLQTTSVSKFEIVKKGICRAVNHFNTGVSITYNSYYVDSLVDMVKFAVACGAQQVKIDFCSTVFEDGEPKDTYMVEPAILVHNIVRDYQKINEITDGKLVFEMSLPLCIWPEGFIEMLEKKDQITSVCHMVKRQGIVISHDGQLIMCNGMFDFPIGRYGIEFNDSRSLLNLLNCETVNNYYTQISRYPSDTCQLCDRYQDCGGGCPLRWAIYDPSQLVKPIYRKEKPINGDTTC